MTEFTTMEKLQMMVGPSGAVLKYGEKVLVTCETYYGFTAEVYEFVETPEETGFGYIECRLSLIERQRSILKMADTPLHGASAGIRREE